jgi:hypothetical protein
MDFFDAYPSGINSRRCLVSGKRWSRCADLIVGMESLCGTFTIITAMLCGAPCQVLNLVSSCVAPGGDFGIQFSLAARPPQKSALILSRSEGVGKSIDQSLLWLGTLAIHHRRDVYGFSYNAVQGSGGQFAMPYVSFFE